MPGRGGVRTKSGTDHRATSERFFTSYETSYARIGKCRLERFEVEHEKKVLRVYANPAFGYQPFTEENVSAIYRLLKQSLPGPVNYYTLQVYADDKLIEDLVPNAYRKKQDKTRLYGKLEAKGNPWVTNVSRPYEISRGLEGRHIALWQSHGKVYRNERNEWRWQRPRLFCTTEDLFTQSFVVPYLIPMLENAGAVVFTPRERDWQRHEVIVDNNTCTKGSHYLEVEDKNTAGKIPINRVLPRNTSSIPTTITRLRTVPPALFLLRGSLKKPLPSGFLIFRKKGNTQCT